MRWPRIDPDKASYRDELFKEVTGKSADELWKDFTDSLRKRN